MRNGREGSWGTQNMRRSNAEFTIECTTCPLPQRGEISSGSGRLLLRPAYDLRDAWQPAATSLGGRERAKVWAAGRP